jgi:uncharacterized protein
MKREKGIDRRTFLKTTAIGCASVALSSGLACNSQSDDLSSTTSAKKDLPSEALAKEGAPKISMPTRLLGKTGVSVPVIGLGGDIDWTINQSLLRMAFQTGITLWDSGHSYMNGKGEIGYGQFFSKYPESRKNIFLTSKASWDKVDPAGLSEHLDISMERLQTDYIDLYGMHSVTNPAVFTSEIKTWAEQKKKEGRIKFFGFSAHKNLAPLLKKAAGLGWIDAVIASYNYQLASDDAMKKAIEQCSKAGVGIIAMKSQGLPHNIKFGLSAILPGDLTTVKHFTKKGYSMSQAKLKMVWENEKISSCLSQITNLTILKENIAAATDNVKLSSGDIMMLNRLARINCDIYCTGCMRCESVMRDETMIPDVLRYMMYYNSYGKRDEARRLFGEMPTAVRDAMASRDYSIAEAICPNRIQIGKAMREASILLA